MSKKTKKTKNVVKAESNDRIVVPVSGEKGQPRIVTSSYFIQDARRVDLKMPTRLCTFDNMCEDDAVYNSIDITNLMVLNSLYNGMWLPGPSNSSKSKIAADFLNYCIRNMSFGTWLEALQNAVTDLKYGYSLLNIVTEKRNYGEYRGSRVLKKLAPRDQKSVYGWIWDKDFRELQGFVQRQNLKQTKRFRTNNSFLGGLSILSTGKYYEMGYPIIRSKQLLHFKYNTTNNNPQGDSPLLHCYKAWMEKALVEKYEVIGVSKDLGGAVVLRVPSSLIERANNPTQYPNEAAEYAQLQEDAAKLHAGESSYIVLTSDVDEITNTKLYDFELKGIDGGGKQYNTSDIIDQKRKSIYNVFGTGFLLLGQNAVGSYNLSDNATSTHGYYVERNILQKVDVLNNQLAPRLLAINDVSLSWKDMPVYQYSDPTEFDPDVASKVIQRTKSVNGLTPQALEYLYQKLGWPTDGIEEIDFSDKGDSRSGESMGSSGTGNTQDGGGATSTSNNENSDNKSLEKHFVLQEERDDEFVIEDVKTNEVYFIDKQGS